MVSILQNFEIFLFPRKFSFSVVSFKEVRSKNSLWGNGLMQHKSNAESSERNFMHYIYTALSSHLSKRVFGIGSITDPGISKYG